MEIVPCLFGGLLIIPGRPLGRALTLNGEAVLLHKSSPMVCLFESAHQPSCGFRRMIFNVLTKKTGIMRDSRFPLIRIMTFPPTRPCTIEQSRQIRSGESTMVSANVINLRGRLEASEFWPNYGRMALDNNAIGRSSFVHRKKATCHSGPQLQYRTSSSAFHTR